jgi:hypothetical protein
MLVNQTEEEIDQSNWDHLLQSPWNASVVAVVDRTANIDKAPHAIAQAAFSFGGRSNYSPQIVLVNDFVADIFLRELLSIMPGDVSSTRKDTPKVHGQRDQLSTSPSMNTLTRGTSGNIVEVFNRYAEAIVNQSEGYS